MGRGRTETHLVRRGEAAGALRRVPERLAVEEPMEIRLDEHLVATTMRTPGHDFELAVGFLHGEGLLAALPVEEVRYCATGSAVDTGFNVVTVATGGLAPVPQPRLGLTTSACGACGRADPVDLVNRLAPLDPDGWRGFTAPVLAAVPAAVRPHQLLFTTTGGVHGAAVFDPEGLVHEVREDVGRHNAVDKVVGRLRLDGRLPAGGLGLFVTGRAGFELVAKAWAAGFSAMVAVGAPSGLAVRTARAANLLLAGFVRDDRLTVYSPEGA